MAWFGQILLENPQVFDGALALTGISLQDGPCGLGRFIHRDGEARGEIVRFDIVVTSQCSTDLLKASNSIEFHFRLVGASLYDLHRNGLGDARIQRLKDDGIGGVDVHRRSSLLREDRHVGGDPLDDFRRESFDEPEISQPR